MWVQQKDYKVVGKILRQARERAELGQQELANHLRKPQSFISSYESGQRRVDVLELLRICAGLKCDPIGILREISSHFSGAKPRGIKQ